MPSSSIPSDLNTRAAYKRLVPAILILLGGCILTVYLYFNALEHEETAIERNFQYTIRLHKESLTRTINRKVSALRSIQTLFSFSDQVTRKEFEGASRLAIKEGIPALKWVPIVSHTDRSAFEARAQAYGYSNYSIRQFGPNGKLIPASDAEEYYPILFVYPLEDFVDLLGLDLKRLPSRQELQFAIQTSQPVGSMKMEFVQQNLRPDSWILSIPVYEAEYFIHEINISNPQVPKGFIQAILYLDDLFAEAWNLDDNRYVHISVDNISDKSNPIAFWRDPDAGQSQVRPGEFKQTTIFTALQQEWQLTFVGTPHLRDFTRSHVPFTTLVIGGVITCLLAALVYHLLLIRHEVELQVKDRTQDLRLANDQLNQEIAERRKSEAVRSELEKRLQHSQKMEAIGTLAGGIAHDFNNILAAVLGYVELIKDEVKDNSSALNNLSELEKACFRARDLIRQILTFSRLKEEKRNIIHPATVVNEAINLLSATTPRTIALRSDIDESVSCIEAHQTQIHQIVVNLITNAIHAIGEGSGRIEIRLAQRVLSIDDQAVGGPIPAGKYVYLSIKDNGSGMDQTTLNRIFEPYYTTKETGQGTGMGLSVVHGIVNSNQGHIVIESTPGMGSCFQIFFPAKEAPAKDVNSPKTTTTSGNNQLIVVVDDEEAITSLIEMNLVKKGYQVKAFTDSSECMTYLQNSHEHISLLVTDSAMPQFSGLKLLEIVRKKYPLLPVILYSGRITEEDITAFKQLGVDSILHKPVSFSEMYQCITELLSNTSNPNIS